jgi:hypothetical protein
VPFAAQEAPRAVLFASEAESCFGATTNREARQRVHAKREVYQSELRQRWNRSQLGLELARRRGQLERTSDALDTLLALSSGAGTQASAYRSWLERERRKVHDELEERAKEEEEP